jgi:hypothetical protein
MRRFFPWHAPSSNEETGAIDTYTEIAVSPEDDIEYRRITLSNFTGKPPDHRAHQLRRSGFGYRRRPMPHIRRSPTFFMQTEILRDRMRDTLFAQAAFARGKVSLDVPSFYRSRA